MSSLHWNFDNTYIALPDFFYAKSQPERCAEPELIIWNEALAQQMGLKKGSANEDEVVSIFSGNLLPEGSYPIAQAYAGHQFGHFNMLGDGRAILLGEHITPHHQRLDVQLKGAGVTNYSRRGDGKASLSSMLREYIISEAMYGLGIPTSRSLAVVATGEEIHREELLKGAVLTRIAASHIRVGTFQFARAYKDMNAFKTFTNYVIQRHYPECLKAEHPVLMFFQKVMNAQIQTVVHWMRVGFIHGVQNTDNVSISGETFDYGPCAFMNVYHPDTVFSSIDREGRYAFGNQSQIGLWNLARFAESLIPLIHEDENVALSLLQEEINQYGSKYETAFQEMMLTKLGLTESHNDDVDLINQLLSIMQADQMDYTNTFLSLEFILQNEKPLIAKFSDAFENWKQQWMERIGNSENQKAKALNLMRKNNPRVIPRNHLVERALNLASEHGDMTFFRSLLQQVQNPYTLDPIPEAFQLAPVGVDLNYKTFCGT